MTVLNAVIVFAPSANILRRFPGVFMRRRVLFSRIRIVLVLCVAIAVCCGCVQAQIPLGTPTEAKLDCSTNVGKVYPGDTVVITGAIPGLSDQSARAAFDFSWTGPQVTGSDLEATFVAPDTPGIYTVHGKATVKGAVEGFANCAVTITVAAFDPPAISCFSNPSSVQLGENSTITATGVSPQNRSLHYQFSSSAGLIAGSGSNAVLSTNGTQAGAIIVSCSIVDDRGQTATATTSVTVMPVMSSLPTVGVNLPALEWPLPHASARKELPLAVGGSGLKKLGDVNRRLTAALAQVGYVNRSYYSVPGGFALVTRKEWIYPDGRSQPPPDRFSKDPPKPHGLLEFLSAQFTAKPGYYRILVFVVTNVDINDSNGVPTETQMNLLLDGPGDLPASAEGIAVPPRAKCTVLIYEFRNAGVDSSTPASPIPSDLSAEQHLRQARLWDPLLGR